MIIKENPTGRRNGQDGNNDSGGQPPEGLAKSKCSSPDSGLRSRSSRLAQLHWASNAQQRFESSDYSGSDNDNFLDGLLEKESEGAFCTMLQTKEEDSERRTTRGKRRPLPRETALRSPRTARVKPLPATARNTLPDPRWPKAPTRMRHQRQQRAERTPMVGKRQMVAAMEMTTT